ncbi:MULTISPECIES: MMPL family transporter [unclassified Microbacterium]|uniref:MMPL family transporter n=1 Tax=unclassified Microbacterium TaxID=2609290 RepID=UPI000DE416B3|nr:MULTISPECIES: MMPL family transporter [unclassified Microbacterium]NYF29117.1 RND superfamily putative drug exporter [Microbacterium sp. JAI119]RBO74414.1 MMPL family transporter [Microbacterium sp. H6]
MSTLLSSLGRWSFRHPWRVLVSWLLALGIAGAGALVLGAGTDNTFSIPGTESQAGLEQLSRSFPQVSGTNAQFIVVAADGDKITDAEYQDDIEGAVDELGDLDGVLAATSPYDEMVKGMINDDDTAAIVRVQFDGESTDVSEETKDALRTVVSDLGAELPTGSQTSLGGDLFAISIPGVTLTEAVGLLIALLVLIVTFRSFVVAGLPLLTAILGVGISMAGIFTATAFATVSSTTPLLALMLGLAVGIDYALFIMARHQDQVRDGVDPEESASRAVGTAGSAVVFAGVTVLIALIGLGFAGIPFLTTMGIAASAAVAVAVAIAVTLTPALLGFMKGRVVGRPKKVRTPKTNKTAAGQADDSVPSKPVVPVKGSARWVGGVMKHPVLVSIAVVLGLGIVAVPALSLDLALPNAGVLPKDNEARQTYDLVGEEFGPGFNGPMILTGTIVTSTDPLTLMEDLGDAVAKVPGVKEVALATPNETADTGIVQIVPETAPDDPATADLVRELRSHHDEWLDEFGIDLKVTGFTAVGIDISDQLGNALLPFGVFVIGLSLILLTIVFRSLWVPITAAIGYLLSIVAAFGVVGAVFEWGWFADLLHVAKVGPIISFMPIILMGVLFGLAMDYQVFLVSRMREDFVHDKDAKSPDRATRRAAALRAVRSGFTGSAKVVTAAGLIMFAVFVAFVPEGDSSLKPIALGLAAGIAFDAFLVRMTLIPALMAILGERAWELPGWLEKILPRIDVEGEAVERERHLAAWPGDGSVVAADDLEISADAPLIENLSMRIPEGGALIATGGDHRSRRALALTIAGRLTPTEGRLRVAGHLLPGRAAWVRAHVGCVLIDDADTGLDDLAEALRGKSSIVGIDGIDRLSGGQRDQATAMLRDAAATRTIAVFTTASDADSARTTLAEAGWPDAQTLDTRAPRPSAAESTEVTA